MKPKNITPNHNEKLLREQDFIVSKTDSSGRITYGNRIFIEFSGYTEEELLNTQHNIIRHPDMPRGVFKLLWDTLKQEKEVFAFVKNMAKDGAFYWVFANVSPSYSSQKQVEGYLSIRRKPNPQAIDIVAGLYAQMLEVEKATGPKDACQASIKYLHDYIKQKGTTYEELVLKLQG